MTAFPQLNNFSFRSKVEINGWPLIHINIGTNPETGRSLVAKGLIAIGNRAIGIVSIGSVAIGVVTIAGIGLGVVSLASVAIGSVALGAIALGYKVALGSIVLSSDYSLGAITIDQSFFLWSLGFAALIALVLWSLSKVKALQL